MDGEEAPETVPLYPTSPELHIDPACISKHIYSEWSGILSSARLSPSGILIHSPSLFFWPFGRPHWASTLCSVALRSIERDDET